MTTTPRISKPAMFASVPAIALTAFAFALVGTSDRAAVANGPAAVKAPHVSAPSQPVILAQAPAPAKSAFTPEQRRELEAIIKDYLVNNPEVMIDVQQALEAKQEKIQAERTAAALKDNASEIFRSPTTPTTGNLKGDVTVVEFFDYNCGYCKKAFGDLAKLIERDANVRVVLKELPILSKGSEETARVALAAKAQGKYWEFHRSMLTASGTATEASALRVAEKIPGIDMTRLKKDMASEDVKKEIEDTRKLAQKMGVQGTPFFMVGDRLIPGAPEGLVDMLAQQVAEIRKSGGCKVC